MEFWTAEFWEENSLKCLEELNDDLKWSKIPLLNKSSSHLLKEGQLVRFKGMIQDMLNPVYYKAKYEVLNLVTNEKSVRSGKYKDSLQCAEHEKVLDSEDCEHHERRPIYCITVPAVNQWAQCKNVENEPSDTRGVKRYAGADESKDVENSRLGVNGESANKPESSETSMETESSEKPSGPINLNLPIPDSQAEACLINLYDLDKASSLKMNDVIEVAGFLSYDPAAVTSNMEDSAEPFLPPSEVPRLHAVVWRTVNTELQSNILKDAARLRDELRLVLTPLLMGDTLSADYLICHLISRVYLRQDLLTLGKFSLNLRFLRLPEDYTTQLYKFLQTLLEKSHYWPMTIENLNSTVMIPKKNYETNRLDSGILQLSSKTHLVLDETHMTPGVVNDRGVHNFRALSSVIKDQRLEYDFQFYPVEFHTDIPVLIFSDAKSILPCDYQVVIRPDCSSEELRAISETFTSAARYLQEPLLSQLRSYISTVTNVTYDLTDDIQKIVQEDFVKMRQENPKTTAQDLHSLLVLARYLSLSEGCQSLTKECWARALEMERERKKRLAELRNVERSVNPLIR